MYDSLGKITFPANTLRTSPRRRAGRVTRALIPDYTYPVLRLSAPLIPTIRAPDHVRLWLSGKISIYGTDYRAELRDKIDLATLQTLIKGADGTQWVLTW